MSTESTRPTEDAAGDSFPSCPMLASASSVFDGFASHNDAVNLASKRGHAPLRGKRSTWLNPRSTALYKAIWMAFANHLLLERNVAWHQATETDAQRFLNSVNACSRREQHHTPAPALARHTSQNTKERYLLVLQRVYEYSLNRPEEPRPLASPVSQTTLGTPDGTVNQSAGRKPPNRRSLTTSTDTYLLHPTHTKLIKEAVRADREGIDARNDAMVSLMLYDGLTPAELAALKCDALVFTHSPSAGWALARAVLEQPGTIGSIKVANVSPGRKGQKRELVLHEASAKCMANWLRWRGTQALRMPASPTG